jgi:hypothetical protein
VCMEAMEHRYKQVVNKISNVCVATSGIPRDSGGASCSKGNRE